MTRVFVKPLWNVRHDVAPERTTLGVESVERRYGTGRGYCVTADSAKEALRIAFKWQRQQHDKIALNADSVQLIIHAGVPVLMDAPRWITT